MQAFGSPPGSDPTLLRANPQAAGWAGAPTATLDLPVPDANVRLDMDLETAPLMPLLDYVPGNPMPGSQQAPQSAQQQQQQQLMQQLLHQQQLWQRLQPPPQATMLPQLSTYIKQEQQAVPVWSSSLAAGTVDVPSLTSLLGPASKGGTMLAGLDLANYPPAMAAPPPPPPQSRNFLDLLDEGCTGHELDMYDNLGGSGGGSMADVTMLSLLMPGAPPTPDMVPTSAPLTTTNDPYFSFDDSAIRAHQYMQQHKLQGSPPHHHYSLHHSQYARHAPSPVDPVPRTPPAAHKARPKQSPRPRRKSDPRKPRACHNCQGCRLKKGCWFKNATPEEQARLLEEHQRVLENLTLSSCDRVPMVETATGRTLAGAAAPSRRHLKAWMHAHPGWEIKPGVRLEDDIDDDMDTDSQGLDGSDSPASQPALPASPCSPLSSNVVTVAPATSNSADTACPEPHQPAEPVSPRRDTDHTVPV